VSCRIGLIPGLPFRWIFCLLGCLTLVIGVVMFFVLPDSPSNWRFFTPRQRALAVARIARAQTGIKNHVVKPYQIKEAFLDIKVWM
jgi:ACS family allantoate permease-like MFS transporter